MGYSGTILFPGHHTGNSYTITLNKNTDTYSKKYGESLLYECFSNNTSFDAITQDILNLFLACWKEGVKKEQYDHIQWAEFQWIRCT